MELSDSFKYSNNSSLLILRRSSSGFILETLNDLDLFHSYKNKGQACERFFLLKIYQLVEKFRLKSFYEIKHLIVKYGK